MIRTRVAKDKFIGVIWHPEHPLHGKLAELVVEDSRGLTVKLLDYVRNPKYPTVQKIEFVTEVLIPHATDPAWRID